MSKKKILKAVLKKKPIRDLKFKSPNVRKANALIIKANKIMGQAMKPDMVKGKRNEASSLKGKAYKLLKNESKGLNKRASKIKIGMDKLLDEDKEFIKGGPRAVKAYDKARDKYEKLIKEAEEAEKMSNEIMKIKRAIGGAIKKGAKAVVKRGRKSKRGRPKKKVETPVVTKKKQDPFKIKKLPGESDAAFKKRKASITKLRKQQEKEKATESKKSLPSTKERTAQSRVIPPERKKQSKKQFRRRVQQGLIGVTKKGETKNIGRYAEPTEDIFDKLGYTKGSSRGSGQEFSDKELEALGYQIKKAGGPLKPIPAGNKGLPNLPTVVRNKMGFMKAGGKIQRRAGGGVALRGFGVTRKK